MLDSGLSFPNKESASPLYVQIVKGCSLLQRQILWELALYTKPIRVCELARIISPSCQQNALSSRLGCLYRKGLLLRSKLGYKFASDLARTWVLSNRNLVLERDD